MKPEVINELNQAKTINDLFDVLRKYYELENTELSILYKNILINNLGNVINLLNVKERTNQ